MQKIAVHLSGTDADCKAAIEPLSNFPYLPVCASEIKQALRIKLLHLATKVHQKAGIGVMSNQVMGTASDAHL